MLKRPKRIRLNLEFSPTVLEQMKAVQLRIGASSLTEVIRRALALIDTVTEDTAPGGKIQMVNADGEIETIKLVC